MIRGNMNDMARAAFSSLPFVRGMARMCDDGWAQGWHERNGGNASYRLTSEDVAAARSLLRYDARAWTSLDVDVPALSGEAFLVTATGSFMRNVADDPASTLGIVEVSEAGDAYRVLCGFDGGGHPTSEFAGHLLIHAARMQASGGAARVVYHAHPASVIALTHVLPLDAGAFSRALWGAMTECVMVFPEGVGVVGCEVPGSLELARASAVQMQRRRAVVWAFHGLLSTGDTFDDAFGRMHAIVKAADIVVAVRSLSGVGAVNAVAGSGFGAAVGAGSDAGAGAATAPLNRMTDDDLRAIAKSLGITLDEELLG